MKVRVYGFKFESFGVPPAMQRTDIYAYLAANPGGKFSVYRFGVDKIKVNTPGGTEEWWGGMVLKIRDAAEYMKITEAGGKTILTAEHLADNEKLVELNFFVANPETGNGLYAHHSGSASLLNFGWLCRKLFNRLRKANYKRALLLVASRAEKAALKKEYIGELTLGQLCLDADLKELVRKLERVKSFEYRFTTVKTHERFLRGIAERAKSETIKFVFPEDADVDDLADAIDASIGGNDVEELKVSGVDQHGKTHDYRLQKNPLVFDEFDYDQMAKGLRLDLSDWGGSIKKSAVIAKLATVASRPSVMQLLTKA